MKNGEIRFALSAIKNLGELAIKDVTATRERDGNFKSLVDFCSRPEMKNFGKRALENLIKSGAFDGIEPRRTALLEYLDSAVAEGKRRREDNVRGQSGLFDEENFSEIEIPIPKIPERPKNEILAWEKETLGFYMTGHPLEEFSEKLSGLTELHDVAGKKIKIGKRIKIGGLITNSKRLTTKKGEMMAFITLEDFSGELKVTIFPCVFNRCMNTILPDEVVIISGKPDDSRGEIQFLADTVTNAKNYVPEIFLTITPEKENPETIARLKKFFSDNPGAGQVYWNRFGKWQRVGANVKISSDKNLKLELKKILGAENVRYC